MHSRVLRGDLFCGELRLPVVGSYSISLEVDRIERICGFEKGKALLLIDGFWQHTRGHVDFTISPAGRIRFLPSPFVDKQLTARGLAVTRTRFVNHTTVKMRITSPMYAWDIELHKKCRAQVVR